MQIHVRNIKMETKMHLLFTAVGRRIELLQAFREAALVLGKPVKLYGTDVDGAAPALAFCDCAASAPGIAEPGYVDALLRLCEEEHIRCVIPTIDTDLLPLSENRARFRELGTRVLVSSPRAIEICRDKLKTAALFRRCGLRCPAPAADWRAYRGGFPAFIKPRTGSASVNAFRVEDEEALAFYAARIPDHIIQPYISGREFTVDVFCGWDGDPISIVPRERLRVRAGEVARAQISMDGRIIEACKILCGELKPCGPITVQLIRDEAGLDWYTEINPRFGGGAPLSMKAGAGSAEALLKLLDGEAVEPCRVADGAVYSRFDQSVCIREGPGPVRGVIFDLDDTLYNEKDYVRSGFRAVSDYLGGGHEAALWDYFQAGKPAIDALLGELGREAEAETALHVYRSHRPSIRPAPGIPELLERLRARNVKIGVITDGRPEGQRNKLAALGLAVDDVIVTDELGGVQFRKPCDIAFRIMLTRWRLHPSEVIYVGDNPAKDFLAPRQLGMRTVYYRNPDGLYSENAPDDAGISALIDELLEEIDGFE